MMRGLLDRVRRPVNGGARASSRGELLARLARAALWTAIAIALIRGLGDVLGGGQQGSSGKGARTVHVDGWPDDGARALAVQFATAYLSHSPDDDPVAVMRGLATMSAPAVVDELAPRFPGRAARQTVRSAAIADAARLDDRHALITVAVTVQVGRAVTATRLAVPVARDEAGGLVVDDLPSFAPAPGLARTDSAQSEPLLGAERGPIQDVLTRFVRAYLAADPGGLRYLAVPGARIAVASVHLELLSLTDVQNAGPAGVAGRLVIATAHVRDPRSKVAYWLRYRVRLVKRDRWYVTDLNGPKGRGGGEPVWCQRRVLGAPGGVG